MSNSSKANHINLSFNIDEHLIHLFYSDGFCSRLLSIELLIDLDFQFYLRFESDKTEASSIQGVLPQAISEKIIFLLENNLTLLNEEYFIHPGASGLSHFHLKINQFGSISNVSIGLSFEEHKNFSALENKIFATLVLLNQWLEEKTGFLINSEN